MFILQEIMNYIIILNKNDQNYIKTVKDKFEKLTI
jgi:hypothetical protein